MSLKIFDGGNIKNYTIINKNQKEKTDLLENIRLTDNFEKNIHLVANKINKYNSNNKTDNTDNNGDAINSERVELAKNNRPKKYKRKNQLKKENENFLNSLKSGSGFKIIHK